MKEPVYLTTKTLYMGEMFFCCTFELSNLLPATCGLDPPVLKKFEFDKGSSLFSANQLNELKTRAPSKFVVVMFFVYIINK